MSVRRIWNHAPPGCATPAPRYGIYEATLSCGHGRCRGVVARVLPDYLIILSPDTLPIGLCGFLTACLSDYLVYAFHDYPIALLSAYLTAL